VTIAEFKENRIVKRGFGHLWLRKENRIGILGYGHL
jgi:hypothetical protein